VTTAQGGGRVVSLTHRPSLPPGNTPGTQKDFMSMKNPLTPAGIERATFRIVAQQSSGFMQQLLIIILF